MKKPEGFIKTSIETLYVYILNKNKGTEPAVHMLSGSSLECQAYIAEFEGILRLNKNIWPGGGETGG